MLVAIGFVAEKVAVPNVVCHRLGPPSHAALAERKDVSYRHELQT